MSNKINFTKALIQGARTQGKNRLVLRDMKITGLQRRVSQTGVKTFCVYKRIEGGDSERVTLGRFPDVTIENARRMALIINAEIASGANPAKVKRSYKVEMIFKELFEDYLEKHAKYKCRTWEKDLSRYQCYLEKPLSKKRHS